MSEFKAAVADSADGVSVKCAVLHTDAKGNVVDCPGYPHPPEGDDPAPGLVPCPQCTDAVVDLDEHLKWCGAAEPQPEPEAGQEPEPGPGPEESAVAPEQDEPEEDEEAYAQRVAAARHLLAEDEQRRMRACLADIEAACARHGMSLDLEPARLVLRPAG